MSPILILKIGKIDINIVDKEIDEMNNAIAFLNKHYYSPPSVGLGVFFMCKTCLEIYTTPKNIYDFPLLEKTLMIHGKTHDEIRKEIIRKYESR